MEADRYSKQSKLHEFINPCLLPILPDTHISNISHKTGCVRNRVSETLQGTFSSRSLQLPEFRPVLLAGWIHTIPVIILYAQAKIDVV